MRVLGAWGSGRAMHSRAVQHQAGQLGPMKPFLDASRSASLLSATLAPLDCPHDPIAALLLLLKKGFGKVVTQQTSHELPAAQGSSTSSKAMRGCSNHALCCA